MTRQKAAPKEMKHSKARLHARIHQKTKQQYYRVMPDRKRHRILVWATFVTVAVTIAGQLLYPHDRTLPLARIDGQLIGWQKESDLVAQFEERFRETKLKLSIQGGATKEYPLTTTGAHLETDRIIRSATYYPFWMRYVPLSVFWSRNYEAREAITITPSILKSLSEKVAEELSYEPRNARLQIKDGKLEAYAEKPGRSVDAKAVSQQITEAARAYGGTIAITVSSKEIMPTTTAQSLQEVREQAEQALAISLTFTAEGRTFTPEENERASWLVLDGDETGATQLHFDEEKFKAYLMTIDKEVGVPAGQTRITLVNGHETARQTGADGRTIDAEQIISGVQQRLLEGRDIDTVELPFRPISPQVIYNESYTATQDGLRAYVNDAARRYNVAIAIQQVSGEGWSADARADVSMPSASTYKLYVAKMLFDSMDRGEVSWDDRILDTTVSVCFDRMTIASTNPCAEEWIRRFGRAHINETLYGLGFSGGTTFLHSVATHTTARDLRTFMLGLNNGSLVGEAHRDRLLRSLSTHSYRQGIPAGSQGQVYDKVGFLWDYTHDAAIVNHPRGTYVMVVMTKGQSYARIAAITREVEKIMYP